MAEQGDAERLIESGILSLVSKRESEHHGATICPSEVPRTLSELPGEWRNYMGLTRAVALRLALEGKLDVTQKGRVVPHDMLPHIKGPIRLRYKNESESGP